MLNEILKFRGEIYRRPFGNGVVFSGLELVKKVRSAHMALPVILVSGNLPAGELTGTDGSSCRHVGETLFRRELGRSREESCDRAPSLASKPSRCLSSAKENSATGRTSDPA